MSDLLHLLCWHLIPANLSTILGCIQWRKYCVSVSACYCWTQQWFDPYKLILHKPASWHWGTSKSPKFQHTSYSFPRQVMYHNLHLLNIITIVTQVFTKRNGCVLKVPPALSHSCLPQASPCDINIFAVPQYFGCPPALKKPRYEYVR